MKKSLILFGLFCLPMLVQAQDITGKWYGKANLGVGSLRIVFDLAHGENGWSARMQSPDQSEYWGEVPQVAYEKDSITLGIPRIAFVYSGKVLSEQQIEGSLTQFGRVYPLNLFREEVTFIRPQEPKPKYPYAVEEVVFRNETDGIRLTGTLTAPFGDASCPVVILVSGSGSQDRDETVARHKPFWIIADYLTRNGIAVLRYDDRGVGQSEGVPGMATIETLSEDVLAAIRLLKGRKRFADSPAGIIGHSLGSAVALVAAAQGETDFIINLAGMGIKGTDMIKLQRQAILAKAGTPGEFIEKYNETMAKAEQIAFQMEKANPEELKQKLDSLFKGTVLDTDAQINAASAQLSQPEMLSLLQFDPANYFPAVKCPVMALNGEKDLQVIAGANLEGFQNGLLHNPSVVIKAYPNLNHLFQTAKTGMIDEYEAIEETFNPAVLKDMSDWILEMTGK